MTEAPIKNMFSMAIKVSCKQPATKINLKEHLVTRHNGVNFCFFFESCDLRNEELHKKSL